MKLFIVIFFLLAALYLFNGCNTQASVNMKDLDENMLDLRTYHENIGYYIQEGDADYALWLLQGMDSSLQVIARKFTTHRKIKGSFKEAYREKLRSPIRGIRSALEKNDFPKAIEKYRLLTRKCNSCHTDNDIDKEVLDRTLD